MILKVLKTSIIPGAIDNLSSTQFWSPERTL